MIGFEITKEHLISSQNEKDYHKIEYKQAHNSELCPTCTECFFQIPETFENLKKSLRNLASGGEIVRLTDVDIHGHCPTSFCFSPVYDDADYCEDCEVKVRASRRIFLKIEEDFDNYFYDW